MLYSLLAPGKRIRPMLSLATSELFGFDFKTAFFPAASLELIHCFTLIHDDLPCLDNDDFRRGKPSNHKVHGEATALLAGDAISALAFETLYETPAPAAGILKAAKRLAQVSGPFGVVGGQILEMEILASKSAEFISRKTLEQMHAQKTGALFEAALLMPLDLASVSVPFSHLLPLPECYLLLEKLGKSIGLAFQTLDDIEDLDQDQQRASLIDSHSKTDAIPNNILNYTPKGEIAHQLLDDLQTQLDRLNVHFGNSAKLLNFLCETMLVSKLKLHL